MIILTKIGISMTIDMLSHPSSCDESDIRRAVADAIAGLKELQHYKDLEEQLKNLFGGKLLLEKVVETLKRAVQNGEEKLDYARILTNAEAEKWDKWNDLEEQGRLIELPCKVGDAVYFVSNIGCGFIGDCIKPCDGCNYAEYRIEVLNFEILDYGFLGETVFLTKEEAEAKLAELKGTEE